jgi:hypothetical protein
MYFLFQLPDIKTCPQNFAEQTKTQTSQTRQDEKKDRKGHSLDVGRWHRLRLRQTHTRRLQRVSSEEDSSRGSNKENSRGSREEDSSRRSNKEDSRKSIDEDSSRGSSKEDRPVLPSGKTTHDINPVNVKLQLKSGQESQRGSKPRLTDWLTDCQLQNNWTQLSSTATFFSPSEPNFTPIHPALRKEANNQQTKNKCCLSPAV